MQVLHVLSILFLNGALETGTFVFRELAPIIGLGIALVFTRIEIRAHTRSRRGIGNDEILA